MKLANFTRDYSDILAGGPSIVVGSGVSAHEAGTASMHVASAVTIADAGNYYSSSTVEGALQELGTATGTAYVLSSYGGKETLDSGNTGTAYTIDLSAGNVHDLTINAGTAVLSLTGATNAYACSITLLLRQDGTGNRLVTWPGSVEWPSGTTPTLGTAANGVDVFSLFTLDGGTIWYGFEAGGATAGTASNTVLIYDEGSLMGTATAMDFIGSGVSAAMSGGTAQVTVTTGTASTSIPIFDEGTLMGTATSGLNFTGTGVSGTVTSGTAVITVSSTGLTQSDEGTTSLGTAYATARGIYAKQITIASAGLLTEIQAGVKGNANNSVALMAGVLTDASGVPGNVIAIGGVMQKESDNSAITNMGLGTAVRFIGVPIGTWLASGTYWIAVGIHAAADSRISLAYVGSGSDYTSTQNVIHDGAGYSSYSSSSNNYSISATFIR